MVANVAGDGVIAPHFSQPLPPPSKPPLKKKAIVTYLESGICPQMQKNSLFPQDVTVLLVGTRCCPPAPPHSLLPHPSVSPASSALRQAPVPAAPRGRPVSVLDSPSFTSSLSLSIWACSTYLLMSLFIIF